MSRVGHLSVAIVAEQLRRRVPGGIGTYALGLVQGIAELPEAERPALTLVASRPPSRPDPLEAIGLPVESARLPASALTKLWQAGVCRVGVGDVVHAVSMLVPAPKFGQPLSATVHDLGWRRYPDAYTPRGRRWHEEALRRVARRADVVIVPSEATAEAVRSAAVGIDPGRIAVVPEGADHLPAPDPAQASAVLGRLKVTGPYLLSVSTLEPRKNLARLVEAYELARQDLPEPWPLVVVGPRGWGDEVGLSGRAPDGVVLAGHVDPAALAALYVGARCVAYVPLLEGFGLPVVEAMHHGAPVVSSDVPAAGDAALIVDASDVHSIAAGLIAASCDAERRAALMAAGHRRADELRWVDVARAHVDIWADLRSGLVR